MNRKSDTPAQQMSLTLIPPPARGENRRVLRLRQVCAATGLGRSLIYELQSQNRFPRRIKIGLRAVGWLEHEVQEWLAERIARSRPDS